MDAYTVVYRARDLINKYNPHTGRNASGHTFCGVAEDEEVRAKTSEAHLHATHSHDHGHDDAHAEEYDQAHRNIHRMRRQTGPVSPLNRFCLVTVVADSLFYGANGNTAAAVTAAMVRPWFALACFVSDRSVSCIGWKEICFRFPHMHCGRCASPACH